MVLLDATRLGVAIVFYQLFPHISWRHLAGHKRGSLQVSHHTWKDRAPSHLVFLLVEKIDGDAYSPLRNGNLFNSLMFG